MIDWKKQDKLQMRNFLDSVDFHDICKLILMRLLRREHPNRQKAIIYSEEKRGNNVWDIWMRTEKKEIYVYELQENWSKEWELKKTKDNPDINVVSIQLKKLPRDSIKSITKALSEYVY